MGGGKRFSFLAILNWSLLCPFLLGGFNEYIAWMFHCTHEPENNNRRRVSYEIGEAFFIKRKEGKVLSFRVIRDMLRTGVQSNWNSMLPTKNVGETQPEIYRQFFSPVVKN